MTDRNNNYSPPDVWTAGEAGGGRFASINRPRSGPTHTRELPVGKHSFQLYSLATPNGIKASLMFEELLERGRDDAEYDAWPVDIFSGEQFGTGFVELNPNSKIPALFDLSGDRPIRLFESGSILLHLAEKFGEFLPDNPSARAETLNWLFWQMGSAPFLGGGFGHFFAYAPEPMKYPIDRYTMEVKRQLDVLDRQLAGSSYLAGNNYTLADIANWPWYGELALGRLYDAGEFLQVQNYPNVQRWAEAIDQRPAVQRARRVNRTWGDPAEQMPERHDSRDFAEDEHKQSDSAAGVTARI